MADTCPAYPGLLGRPYIRTAFSAHYIRCTTNSTNEFSRRPIRRPFHRRQIRRDGHEAFSESADTLFLKIRAGILQKSGAWESDDFEPYETPADSRCIRSPEDKGMKDCPSCGVETPESARECPACATELEPESEMSAFDSTDGSAKKRTQMGFPSSSTEESERGAGEKTGEEKTTQFGLPASDQPEEQPEGEGEHGEAGGFDSLDWSDVDDNEESNTAEDDLLSAWGISGEGNVATTPAKGTEPTEQQGEAEPEAVGSAPPNDTDKRTQMGMPRFDPDRISSEHDAADPGETGETASLGGASTPPGPPQQSEVGFDEADQPNTRDVSAGSLRERAREFEPNGERSEEVEPDAKFDTPPEEPRRVTEDESARTDAVPPLQGDSERPAQSSSQSQARSGGKMKTEEGASKETTESPSEGDRADQDLLLGEGGYKQREQDDGAEHSPAPGQPRAPSTGSSEPEPEGNEESEQLFQTIEEHESDAFEDEALEEVDGEASGSPASGEFDFLAESAEETVEPPASKDDESTAEDPDEPPGRLEASEPNADEMSTEEPNAGDPDAGEPSPDEGVAESDGRIPQTYHYLQSALAFGSGLAFSLYLGLQYLASGWSDAPLVVALTIAAGLAGAAHLVVPLTSIEPSRKSVLYGAGALVIGGLVIAALFVESATATSRAYLALGGAIVALGAALVPVVAPDTPY